MIEINLYEVIKQKYIEREVLDKIKTEIKQTAKDCAIYYDYGRMYGLYIAFDIIEKYMAEYENKENRSK